MAPPLAVISGVGRAGQVGEAIADRFARDGWRLVLLDREVAEVEARAATLRRAGATVVAIPCDLTDEDAVAEAVQRAGAPSVRALVCAAGGFAASGPVAEASLGLLRRQLDISLVTAFLTTRAFLPALRADGGAIAYFASAAALEGGPAAGLSGYAAAKAGVVALMRAVAAEEAARGVRANAVAPAAIRTAANVAAMGDAGPYVEREAVADAVWWLCRPGTPVSGQVVRLG